MINQQHAVEVVDLVLEQARNNLISFNADCIPVQVVADNMHFLGVVNCCWLCGLSLLVGLGVTWHRWFWCDIPLSCWW